MRNTIKTIGKNVNITQSDEQGNVEKSVIALADIPNCVNEGKCDEDFDLGLRLIAEYLEHGNNNDENLMDLIKVHRWLVSMMFYVYCLNKNDEPYFVYKNIHFPLVLYCERVAMTNNIEGTLYKRDGELAEKHILMLYREMIDSKGGLNLSQLGIKLMTELHELFIDDVLNGNVKPFEVH